jgi:hypothetical protein
MRLLAILIFTGMLCSAQEQSKENIFALKPAFGFNGCQIHGDNYSGFDKFGVFFGTAVNARVNKRASWELGFYFSQKGSRKNQNPKNGDYTYYRLNLNYLDLPLSFRYLLNDNYFITFGPSVAYLISYREQTERGDWTGDYPFNKFEVGVNIGIGGRVNDRLTIELRSSNSVTPLRSYGILASQVYYPNPVARFFNRGLYSNLLSLFVAYDLRDFKKRND